MVEGPEGDQSSQSWYRQQSVYTIQTQYTVYKVQLTAKNSSELAQCHSVD